MTIDEFIATTQKVIARNGFDQYLPTLVLETRRTIRVAVLEDVPPGIDTEAIAKHWASNVVKPKHDYFLAFKVDEGHFKVVARRKGVLDERLVPVEFG